MAEIAGQQVFEGLAGRIRTIADAADLLAQELSTLAVEELRVIHLDKEGGVLGISASTSGRSTDLDLPVREIVRDAMKLGACGLLLAHNHPAGDPTPSPADKHATRRLADAARALEIRLLDHLVIGRGEYRSFRAMGLL